MNYPRFEDYLANIYPIFVQIKYAKRYTPSQPSAQICACLSTRDPSPPDGKIEEYISLRSVETCGLVETGRLVDTANAMHQFI